MLKVDNLSAGYGRLQILSDVSLEALPGELTIVVPATLVDDNATVLAVEFDERSGA